ncbi:MAG: hypothetical protein KJ915_10745 [Candidatus Omnitrophica bacterium]|nr:hypothetical protein [Candidatus Omnitrophota bacterium]
MINKKTICFDKKYFIVFGVTITLALLYSMPKLLPLLNDLNIQTVAEKFDYTMRISQANTFPLLLKHILKPVDSSAGTMFMGVLPLFLCTVSIVILFSRLKKWIFVLAVFIWLSLGPNAIIDLHYIFWHLPIFKSIREISKYYALILVFLISLISGHFFIILKNNASSKKYHIISLVIIVLTYLNLCWANAGYFNVYKQKITDKFSLKNVTYVKAMNMHLADDSSILPLRLALFFKGYGIVGAKVWDPYLDFSSNIIPEYFVLTQYAFLSPSTKAIFIKNPGYKGEVWFLDDANIVKAYSNYQSKIEVQVVVNKPGGMFINQSYSHRWSVNEGEIFNRDNRLFIVLDRVGQYKIVLRYIPIYFYAGLFICFVSVFGSIFIFFKISKRKVSA